MNKKEISMKKGQKVRILRTNQIATIVEVELIRKSGKVHRYCHLKMDKKAGLVDGRFRTGWIGGKMPDNFPR